MNTLVLRIFLLLLSASYVSNVSALEISGTFTLDSSITITKQTSITIEVVNTPNGYISQQSVTLNPGDSSATLLGFSFPSLTDRAMGAAAGSWRLSYSCDRLITPVACDDIVAKGWYSEDGSAVNSTVYDFNLKTALSDTVNSTGLTLAVYPGKALTGKIRMPTGVTATEDIPVSIFAQALTPTGGTTTNFSTEPKILTFDTFANYKITLPNNDAETFQLKYSCFSFNPGCAPYVQTGYFDGSVMNNTSASIFDADTFNNTSTYTNRQMQLLAAETLSGTITLDTAAPNGGLRITVTARNLSTNSTVGVLVDFALGDTTRTYSVPIPADDVDWTLRFSCSTIDPTSEACDNYVAVSYYNSTALNSLVYSALEAQIIDGGTSTAGLNVTFAGSPRISGKLMLVQGVAPAGGLEFRILALDAANNSLLEQPYTLLEGESELDYIITIPSEANRNWQVRYDCAELTTPLCSKRIDVGYYDAATGNTVTDVNMATTLVGGISHSNINLKVANPDDEICLSVKTIDDFAVICF